ncbi:hypothetical protein HMPREF3206_00775 [Fusobacterium equinum]|uniref:Uncharacterized protein n=1 Tax=Fusobacterium equinum TaxID=134605 RepID=A0A133NFM1_9FUSO|nr:hypothetical protein HMPREF3206_00775 [Fusobacterium equinum]
MPSKSIPIFSYFFLYDKYIKYLSIQPPFIIYFISYFLYNNLYTVDFLFFLKELLLLFQGDYCHSL